MGKLALALVVLLFTLPAHADDLKPSEEADFYALSAKICNGKKLTKKEQLRYDRYEGRLTKDVAARFDVEAWLAKTAPKPVPPALAELDAHIKRLEREKQVEVSTAVLEALRVMPAAPVPPPPPLPQVTTCRPDFNGGFVCTTMGGQ